MKKPKLQVLVRAYASYVRDQAANPLCDGAEASALRDVAADLDHIIDRRTLPTFADRERRWREETR